MAALRAAAVALILAMVSPIALAQETTETPADAPVTILRTMIDAETPIIRGQRIDLIVEALTTAELEAAPNPPAPEGDGFIVVGPVDRPTPVSDRQDGLSLAGFRWRYQLFPARAGELRLLPISIEIGDVVRTAEPSPVFVTVPEAFSDGRPYVAATDLTVSQSVSPEGAEFAVGDAITRETAIEADTTVAMLLPAIEPEAIAGLRAYAETPELEDWSSRGSIVASRADRIVYIIEQEGDYTLPAVQIAWWDTDRRRPSVAELPMIDFTASAATAGAPSGASGPDTTLRGWWLVGVVVLALGVAAALRRAPAWRNMLAQSAWAHRQRLKSALASGKAYRAAPALYRYLAATTNAASLRDWLSDCDDQRLTDGLANLFAQAYGSKSGAWDGRAIYRGLVRWQRRTAKPPVFMAEDARLNPVTTPPGQAAKHFAAKRLSLLYD